MTAARMIELAAQFRAYDLNERRAKCEKLRNYALCFERQAVDLEGILAADIDLTAVRLRTLALLIEEG